MWGSASQVKVRLPIRSILIHGDSHRQQHTTTLVVNGTFTLQGQILLLLLQVSRHALKIQDVIKGLGTYRSCMNRAIRRLIAAGAVTKRGNLLCLTTFEPWMIALPETFQSLDNNIQTMVLAQDSVLQMREMVDRELGRFAYFYNGRSLAFGKTVVMPLQASDLIHSFLRAASPSTLVMETDSRNSKPALCRLTRSDSQGKRRISHPSEML
eukprot:TRINITY_DN5132_c0_g1_i1.p1 TRINITY_DN5132_c0_g1~~TRINITY_DN5132_c0_g1_i1.p1  ORF type:complete len:211 (-),score=10.63 TRINITY_DN5132_c0_g1_i1:250-882(-)